MTKSESIVKELREHGFERAANFIEELELEIEQLRITDRRMRKQLKQEQAHRRAAIRRVK